MSRPGLVAAVWLAVTAVRVAAIIAPPLDVRGDGVNYVAHAAYIAEHGRLPPVGVQPHGYPLLLAPLQTLAGGALPAAVRVLHLCLDLALVALLVSFVLEVLPGQRQFGLRLGLGAVVLWQPLTAMFVTAVCTETLVQLLLFLGAWLIAGREHPLDSISRALLGGALLAYAATCRVELVPFGAVLLVVALLARPCGGTCSRPPLRAAGYAAMSYLLVLGGFLALQFWSTGEPWPSKRSFHARGYMDWARTWVTTEKDTTDFAFTILAAEGPAHEFDQYPERAFDDERQKEVVRALISRLNETGYDGELDSAFEALARERREAHPVRTFLVLPLIRVPAYWVNLQGAQTYLRAFPLPRAIRWPLIAAVLVLKASLVLLALVGTSWCLRNSQPCRLAHLGRLWLASMVLRQVELAVLGTVAWAGLVESRYVSIMYPSVIGLALIGAAVAAGRFGGKSPPAGSLNSG